MIRFCFDWCCTDLNRPWPHVAESKVQEISFKRIIGGTKIQSIISQEPEELDKASIRTDRTLETEVNTFLMEVTVTVMMARVTDDNRRLHIPL